MIHYSCDRCGRLIDPQEELRYVVKVEIQATMETAPYDTELVDQADRDHLLEIHEILERADDLDNPLIGNDVYARQRFDLCPECARKFLKNPVGSDPAKQLDFSQN